MKTIIFDEKSSRQSKGSDPSFNRMFVETQAEYMKDKCSYRGYVYLNEVCEAFGVAWNPDDENVCYRRDRGGINLEIEPKEDGIYLIHIS